MKKIHPLPCKVDGKTLVAVKRHCREKGIPASAWIRNLIKEKLETDYTKQKTELINAK